MTRKYLKTAECSQMYLVVNGVNVGPTTGQGEGGDNCTESVMTDIDVTFLIGPAARAAKSQNDIQAILYEFVRLRNPNSDGIHGAPQNGAWVGQWLHDNTGGKMSMQLIPSTFAAYKAAIDAARPVMFGFNNYQMIHTYAGTDPYAWVENPKAGGGHVAFGIGYDDDYVDKAGKHWGQTAIVNDPLRALSGMPWDYSWQSYLDAGLQIFEVMGGPALPYVVNTAPPPTPPPAPAPAPSGNVASLGGWHDDGATLMAPNGQIVIKGFRKEVLRLAALGQWPATNTPLEPERTMNNVSHTNKGAGAGSRQCFLDSVLAWTPTLGVFSLFPGQELLALEGGASA